MSSVSGVSSFLSENAMDINNRDKVTQDKKAQGATSTDFKDAASAAKDRDREPSNELTFEDMLTLMCTQLQNQSIDNTADTNDMMNQLISMTVMQSLTTLTTAVEEVQTASIMNYGASLVGKEVTLGVYADDGESIQEVYGTVEASGTYDGKQVIFVDGQSYFLSSIMAVGKLPPPKEDSSDDKTEGTDQPGGTDTPEGAGKPDNTDKIEEDTDVENNGAGGGTDAGSSVSGKDPAQA